MVDLWIGMKQIVILSLIACTGLLLIILACVLGHNWYPVYCLILFLIAPLPVGMNRKRIRETEEGCTNSTSFTTSFLLTSGIGLTVSMFHATVIPVISLALTIPGGVLLFSAIYYYSQQFVSTTDEE